MKTNEIEAMKIIIETFEKKGSTVNCKERYISGMQGTEIYSTQSFLLLNVIMKKLIENKPFGTWLYDNQVQIDNVKGFNNKSECINFAKEQKQIAIYDTVGNCEIYL